MSLGLGSGLIAALLMWELAGGEPFGGNALLLFTGGLLGLSYAWLFQPAREQQVAALSQGLLLGSAAWVILALNVYPALAGRSPMWEVAAVASSLPQLLAYLFMGVLAGSVYSLAFRGLEERVQLSPSPQFEREPGDEPAVKTTVVIIGGGYAGFAAAETLSQEFAYDPGVAIWLVSSTNYLLHTPLLSDVASGAVDARHITPSLRGALPAIRVVHGEVERVEMEQHRIFLRASGRSPRQTLSFDHLIVAAGAVPNFFGNKSIEQNCFQFKTLGDAVRLRCHIIDLFERADHEDSSEKRRARLTFVVAGGGFAGVELMGSRLPTHVACWRRNKWSMIASVIHRFWLSMNLPPPRQRSSNAPSTTASCMLGCGFKAELACLVEPEGPVQYEPPSPVGISAFYRQYRSN